MNIEEINEYLKEELWMDFEVTQMDTYIVKLHGFIDELCKDSIIISFYDVSVVNISMCFTYDGKVDFLSVIEGSKQAYDINRHYNVQVGNNIYGISGTDRSAEMFIIAKSIKAEVIRW